MPLPPNGLPVEFLTRSWLLIPPLEEAAIATGLKSGADVVVFDLAALSPVRRPVAADALVRFLAGSTAALESPGAPAAFLLLPEPDENTDSLLEILMPARPDGIMFRVTDPRQVQEMDVLIAVHEAMNDMQEGSTRLGCMLAHAIERDFAGLSRRLVALGWDAEAFRSHLGARRMFDRDGRLTDAFRLARASILNAAAEAGLEALDSASGLWSTDRLARDVDEAADDGFTGKFALSPRQVSAINHGFIPDEAEIAEAKSALAEADTADQRRYLRSLRILQRAVPAASGL